MNKFIYIFYFAFTIFLLSACTSNKFVIGKYRDNFSAFGLSMTNIIFNKDSTCKYVESRHLQEDNELDGIFFIKRNKLYIKFIEPKPCILQDTTSNLELPWTNCDEFKSYKLRHENGIEYHCKFKIGNNLLKVYRVDNEKLVRKVLTYNEKKGRYHRTFYMKIVQT